MTSFVLCQGAPWDRPCMPSHATRIVPGHLSTIVIVRPLGLHPMHHHGCFLLSIQGSHTYGCVWKCWVYSQWNSHLIGIMISKTIGFRGLAYFQTHPYAPKQTAKPHDIGSAPNKQRVIVHNSNPSPPNDFLMSDVHSKESLYETPKKPKRTPKETLTFKAPTCSNTMQTWKVEVPKCKYHAKWEVEVPKCHKYHAKWQVLVPNCYKYKANGTRK